MFNLKGRVAVITGASSGLGRQMAEGFARQGADLVLLARRIERLEEFKIELEKLGVKVLIDEIYEKYKNIKKEEKQEQKILEKKKEEVVYV